MRISDWSSDVCSSDLESAQAALARTNLTMQRIDLGQILLGKYPHHKGLVTIHHQLLEAAMQTILGLFQLVDLGDIGLAQRRTQAGIGFLAFSNRPIGFTLAHRSEERRVGNECVLTVRSLGA